MPAVTNTRYTLDQEDLEHVLKGVGPLWSRLAGHRVFITGGTGFFGKWIVESFCFANERLNLGASAVVLTRDPSESGLRSRQVLANPNVTYFKGDVATFDPPPGAFEWFVHGAAEPSRRSPQTSRNTILTIVDGTRRLLDFAERQKPQGVLIVSSGAIYGRQPPSLPHLSEEYLGGPDVTDPNEAYGEAKRIAELMAAGAWKDTATPTKIARCFAFLGPHMPLDGPFAAGNFLNFRLQGRPIQLASDGTALRSYLYASDLAVWLWTILIAGTAARPYNVGSTKPVSVGELAREIARSGRTEPLPVTFSPRGAPSGTDRYIPQTMRAQSELGLAETVALSDGVARTVRWHEDRR